MNAERLGRLLGELDEAHRSFREAVEAVRAAGVTERPAVGDWDARTVVAHVAFWNEHGADALELASDGRGDEFRYDSSQTDRMNEESAAEAAGLDLAAAESAEERTFFGLRSRLAGLAPGLLDLVLGNGDTVEAVVRYDGADHYAEHEAHLRALLEAPEAG